jgi:hypothetical protein
MAGNGYVKPRARLYPVLSAHVHQHRVILPGNSHMHCLIVQLNENFAVPARRRNQWFTRSLKKRITQLDAGGSKFSKVPQGSGVDRHGVTVDILVRGERKRQSLVFRV